MNAMDFLPPLPLLDDDPLSAAPHDVSTPPVRTAAAAIAMAFLLELIAFLLVPLARIVSSTWIGRGCWSVHVPQTHDAPGRRTRRGSGPRRRRPAARTAGCRR